MEIKLKEKQIQIIAKIQAEKQHLQAEFAKVIGRETEALVLVIEGAGFDSSDVEGKQLELKEGGILVISDKKEE